MWSRLDRVAQVVHPGWQCILAGSSQIVCQGTGMEIVVRSSNVLVKDGEGQLVKGGGWATREGW